MTALSNLVGTVYDRQLLLPKLGELLALVEGAKESPIAIAAEFFSLDDVDREMVTQGYIGTSSKPKGK